jgi:hypothetical protein
MRRFLARRRGYVRRHPVQTLAEPDLSLALPVERFAPHRARHAVGQVDRPSPDLRAAVILLVSEIVTHGVQHAPRDDPRPLDLRVWMPSHVVRVELRGPGTDLTRRDASDDPHYGLILVKDIADRWGVEPNGETTLVWFEIDRRR